MMVADGEGVTLAVAVSDGVAVYSLFKKSEPAHPDRLMIPPEAIINTPTVTNFQNCVIIFLKTG